ncbi:Protein COFACTOR ASSEMBLY OF COMPLEX C SUBUNIT B CCB3 chloroplastic [Bienertia sinuspersici]
MATLCKPYPLLLEKCGSPSRRNSARITRYTTQCVSGVTVQAQAGIETLQHGITISQPFSDIFAIVTNNKVNLLKTSHIFKELKQNLVLMDIDAATAKAVIPFIGPFLSAFSFLFIIRIVMSWYPKLPLGKFPYVLAYAPTEPILVPTRKVIPPLAGVDVTPVVWFGLLSFLNEILVGPQGLLVLLSQQT